jgi:hypothetical protein
MDIRDTMLYDLVAEEHRTRLAQSRTAWRLDALRDGGAAGPGAFSGLTAWLRARFSRVGGHEASALEIATSRQ